MFETEPTTTALLLTAAGLLLVFSVLFSRPSERIGVPVVLVFLLIGLLVGAQLPEHFVDFDLAFRLGTVGLVLILFDGGLNTPFRQVRQYLLPASILATAAVVGTALLVALLAHALGLGWTESLLIGAIVSSTDAAAVFSSLRGSGVQLRRRVGATLELESGLNDPMAVILTLTLTTQLAGGGGFEWGGFLIQILAQLGIGLGAGLAIGWLGSQLLERIRVPAAGLYPAVTLALALLAFGLPTLFMGSGFLAVYVAALMLGNRRLPYRSGILRVHDAMAWLAQISMFLILGLLAIPELLAASAWTGLILALGLGLIARPLMVLLCLAPFGYRLPESGFIAWVGLRGAVPILLATYPVLAGVAGASELFHLVFFVVVVNALIPGATVRWAVALFKVERAGRERPSPVLEINAIEALPVQIISFRLDPAALVTGHRAAGLPLPEGADVLLLVRGRNALPVGPDTVLEADDHVHVMLRPEHKAAVELLFGLREED
ncbi:potassium/proton antiporter [Wenzhouxiangella marina]|uniref:Sodium:proton exchanger n=1 Tax=Wenzhouxiangella marina TaxID=1579979 RepID=A0A0K0XXG7_9GAMM|nr:potassium/proton antiporter [Wenzhouxiangella marina]AKS42370.1 Sodium:proton exchanger [Wenzhouxiangella marina]MBB6085857.1 cell volume regulation protein A [Wenzhouxiangella marina]